MSHTMNQFVEFVKTEGIDPKVILDVGSRDLGESLELSKHFPDARIIAFEPTPEQFEICRKNAEGHPNIEVYNLAISDEGGTADFFVVGGNVGGSSLLEPIDVPWSDGTAKKIRVSVRRLDEVLEELGIGSVDLVWMDVQGIELKALRGMGKYLDGVKIMHTEASPRAYYKGHILQGDLEKFLKDSGFLVTFLPAPGHPYGEGDLICLKNTSW